MANSVSSGTLTAVDQTVQIPVAEFGSVGIQLSGTWVGTVQFECGVLSPTVSTGLVAIQVASPTGALVSSATANGLWQVSSGGLSVVRVRCSAYTSGAILVALQGSPASAGAGGAGAATSLPAGTTIGQASATAAALSNVASSVTTVTLLAANAARRGFMIVNDETSTLLVKFGATASTTSFTVSLVAAAYYECPQPIYTGLVAGIWTAAGSGSGAARITEIT